MSMPGIGGIVGVGAGDGAGVCPRWLGGGAPEAEGGAEGVMPGIPGIGGIAEPPGVLDVGFCVPMSIPGIVMLMFCMAAIRFVSESTRNCALVTTRSPSDSPESTG